MGIENSPQRPFTGLWLGVLSLVVVLTLSLVIAGEAGTLLTRNTIRLSLAWYAAVLFLMLRAGAADWRAETSVGRWTRWC